MASENPDAILWLGLIVFGFYASRAVHMQLQAVRTASEITKEDKAPELISQHTEDALKLSTLRQLADGANYDIRMAAIKIITERASHGEAYQILLRDLAGKNPEKRDKALTALKLLEKGAVHDRVCNYATYKALVDCLCRFLADREAYPITEELDTNYSHRPQAEKVAMQLVCHIFRYKLGEAYRAGVVSRWLASYPFGGFSSSESRKREIVQRLKIGSTEDVAMSTILSFLNSEPEGRKQLRNHGLVGSAIGESPDDDDRGDLCTAPGNEVSFRAGFARTREENAEEHALRRRRREAMVLSEGGGPISSEDIIQRDDAPYADFYSAVA